MCSTEWRNCNHQAQRILSFLYQELTESRLENIRKTTNKGDPAWCRAVLQLPLCLAMAPEVSVEEG